MIQVILRNRASVLLSTAATLGLSLAYNVPRCVMVHCGDDLLRKWKKR